LKKDSYDVNVSYENSLYQSKNIYYAPYLKDVVYKITENNVTPTITFNFGKYKIPEKKMSIARQSSKNMVNLLSEGNWAYGVGNIFENDHFITLNLKVKKRNMAVVYSKESGNFFYGSKYQGWLNSFLSFEHIAVNEDLFLLATEARDFKRLSDSIFEFGSEDVKERYQEALNKLSNNSNPVLILIEYNSF
jgi:hypothetical protein